MSRNIPTRLSWEPWNKNSGGGGVYLYYFSDFSNSSFVYAVEYINQK